jgi:hypothetical protein
MQTLARSGKAASFDCRHENIDAIQLGHDCLLKGTNLAKKYHAWSITFNSISAMRNR